MYGIHAIMPLLFMVSYLSIIVSNLGVLMRSWTCVTDLTDLNRDSSMFKSYVDHNVHSFNGPLRSYITGFIDGLLRSWNSLVSTLCSSMYFIYASDLLQSWKDKVYLL